jgi:hypothetical protein
MYKIKLGERLYEKRERGWCYGIGSKGVIINCYPAENLFLEKIKSLEETIDRMYVVKEEVKSSE